MSVRIFSLISNFSRYIWAVLLVPPSFCWASPEQELHKLWIERPAEQKKVLEAVPELYAYFANGTFAVRETQAVEVEWAGERLVAGSAVDGVSAAVEVGAAGDVAQESDGIDLRRFPVEGLESVVLDGGVGARYGATEIGTSAMSNTAARWWRFRVVGIDFSVRREGELGRRVVLQGQYSRVMMPASGRAQGDEQLFRERVTFHSPKPVHGYGWLTFRFLGNADDAVWVYSPIVEKTRRISGINRSDALPATEVALDDFFVFSHKVQQLKVVEASTVEGLVPFVSTREVHFLEQEDGCAVVNLRVALPGSETVTTALFDSAEWQRRRGVGRYMEDAVFAPRTLWRVVAEAVDPFASFGRVVLYVDALTYSPVYKFVYSSAGKLLKSVIASSVFAATKDGEVKTVIPVNTLVHARDTGDWNVMQTHSMRLCSDWDREVDISLFDPSRL